MVVVLFASLVLLEPLSPLLVVLAGIEAPVSPSIGAHGSTYRKKREERKREKEIGKRGVMKHRRDDGDDEETKPLLFAISSNTYHPPLRPAIQFSNSTTLFHSWKKN